MCPLATYLLICRMRERGYTMKDIYSYALKHDNVKRAEMDNVVNNQLDEFGISNEYFLEKTKVSVHTLMGILMIMYRMIQDDYSDEAIRKRFNLYEGAYERIQSECTKTAIG